MEQAIKSVVNGELSILGASELFNVPFTSLYRRVKYQERILVGVPAVGNTPKNSFGDIGRPSLFTSDQEKKLADRVKYLESRGFGVTQKEVRVAAYLYASKCELDIPKSWTDNKVAGKEWCQTFCKRNNLSLRKPEGLSKARASGVNKESMGKLMNEYDLHNNPSHIYNMDETGLPLNNRPSRILAERGKKEVISLTSVERGENVTVIVCCNAIGSFIPPIIIFKGARLNPDLKTHLPHGSLVCMSGSSVLVHYSTAI